MDPPSGTAASDTTASIYKQPPAASASTHGLRLVPRIGIATAIIFALAAGKFLLHVVTNAAQPYGYFRDELYYIACGERLALGFVDHPPLVPVIARLTTASFGDSIDALRVLPALAGAGVVVLTGLMVREFGGGWKAAALACVAATVAPVYLVTSGMLTPVPFDHLVWAACAFFLLRLLKTRDPRYWIAVGVMIGIGLQIKHNAAFLAIAVAAGTLATSNRTYLRSPYLWAGAALAVLIALPNLVWQIDTGWPTIEFAENAASDKNAQGGFVDFSLMQVLAMHPLTLPLWLTGLWWCLFSSEGRQYRMLALLWAVPLVLFLAQGGGKPDYLSPAYPALLAAGAVTAERWRVSRRRAWVPIAATAVLAIGGIAMLPLGVTVLPPDRMESYVKAIGLGEGELQAEKGKSSELPQYYADRFGWESMTATVAGVLESLPEQERDKAVILTGNYGEASAIDFFGDEYGLPPAISGHNNYYLWGPGDATGDVVIALGFDEEFLRERWESVEQAALFTCDDCTSDEVYLPVYVLRHPRHPLDEMWADFKHFG